MALSERVDELELRFMEQQELLQQLSEVLYAQQKTLDRLQAELTVAKRKLEAEPGIVDPSVTDKPPHY